MGRHRPEKQYEKDRPLVTAAVADVCGTVSIDEVVRVTGLSEVRARLVLRVMEQEGTMIESRWSGESGRWFERRKAVPKVEPVGFRYDPRFASKKRLEHMKRPPPVELPESRARLPFRIGTPWAIPLVNAIDGVMGEASP